MYLSHQGAGRGQLTNSKAGGRDGLGNPRLHLRRRHAPGRAQGHTAAGQLVLTNPDMLPPHSAAPHAWAKYFESLRYIVIDELHYYRGVYGPIGNLLRRLKRICEFYVPSRIHLLFATIATPELAERSPGGFTLVSATARRREKFSSSTILRW